MTNLSHVSPLVHHDEVDLFIMMQSLWRQKKLIAGTALLGGVLAIFYIFTATPEYEVSTVLRPVELNDLDALNRSEVYTLPPNSALLRVGAALDSYDARLGYFRAHPELFAAFGRPGRTPEQSFEGFNRKSLKLVQADPKKPNQLSDYIGLEMSYPEGVKGDEILNGFVQYAIDIERNKVASDLRIIVGNRLSEVNDKLNAARSAYEDEKQSQIATLLEGDNLRRAELQDELKALRVQLKAQRESRIAQLDEAIAIARSLGLKMPSTPSSMAPSEGVGGNVIRTEVNNQQNPLYFMGTDALEAERSVLKRRASDDFSEPRVAQIHKELALLSANRKVEVLKRRQNEDVFLKGIESLRAERVRLTNINVDMQHLKMVSVDRLALQPGSPKSPRKALLIGFGLLLGAMLGMVVAMFRHALATRRTYIPVQAPASLAQNIHSGVVSGIKSD
ncbi:Wzz/FepE/Etk N-terminal domain-containing protein [Pseudomonas sp. Irchel 3F5]|uniref:Wzz/FepE/Etk N-terminal domain-containing protein n=1 Tax=Pseudomonas sp. Irchel 3F5 TaxID=2009002 RepID=UPI002114DAD9|nr:Wzz/FepE/Etk N-terminal domain-containing protein [Pseudomonas sp. Irchel 3F5]